MDFSDLIKPELLALIPVLNFIGKIIKDATKIDSAWIPAVLGGIGIVLCAIWAAAVMPLKTLTEILTAMITAMIQGCLCASVAVYGNQLLKQLRNRAAAKREDR